VGLMNVLASRQSSSLPCLSSPMLLLDPYLRVSSVSNLESCVVAWST
jgi:hypothetical protein